MYIRKEFKGDINTLSTEDLNNIDFSTLKDGEFDGITVNTVKRLTMQSLVGFMGSLDMGYISNTNRETHKWRDNLLQGIIETGIDYELIVNKHGIVKAKDSSLIQTFIHMFVDCVDNMVLCDDLTIDDICDKYPQFILKYFSLFEPEYIGQLIDDKMYIDAITTKTLVVFENGCSTEILHDVIRHNEDFGIKLLGEQGFKATKRMFTDHSEYILIANKDLCRRLGFPYIERKIGKRMLSDWDACSPGRDAFKKVLHEIDSTASSFTWDQMMEYIKVTPKIKREYWDYFEWLMERH